MVEQGSRRAGPSANGGIGLPAVIVVVGAIVFVVLSIASWVLYDQTENRLLDQRTREAAAVLEVAIGQIRAPLDAAALLAAATDGDAEAFDRAMASSVGEGRAYTSALLFRAGSSGPVAAVGVPAVLDADRVAALFASGASFKVVDLLADGRRLGYAVADNSQSPRYVVYGERTLSPDPSVRQRNDEPFSQLDYAVYLGGAANPDKVLGGSVADLPMTGRTAEKAFQFGDNQLLLTMTPIGHLSSDLFAGLWWAMLVLGAIVTSTAAWLTRRLLIGRDTALALSAENQRLYQEQRQIAETLQLSLLPQRLALPPGAEVAARYWPAGSAALIGGDFYDAFDVGDGRWAVAIGDVCGKGIGSAALIGLARHTLRSAARHTSSPSEVLRAVHQAMSDHEPSTFCTACFLFLAPCDDGSIEVSLSLGGHPFPLVRRADGVVQTVGAAGSLLGMFEPTLVDSSTVLARGELLMLYTDGLTDAPKDEAVPLHEVEDVLRSDGDGSLELLVEAIRVLKRRRRPHGSGDDTAVMLLRACSSSRTSEGQRIDAEMARPTGPSGDTDDLSSTP